MNTIRRFKNLVSILILYASNLIVNDKRAFADMKRETENRLRITGTVFPKLTTSEKM
ncbi:MAG: hypothetical protein IK093_10220 [Ruminiclostridium sp.]|nr:hypothetical protein [Ruminiclostridium sp.]